MNIFSLLKSFFVYFLANILIIGGQKREYDVTSWKFLEPEKYNIKYQILVLSVALKFFKAIEIFFYF